MSKSISNTQELGKSKRHTQAISDELDGAITELLRRHDDMCGAKNPTDKELFLNLIERERVEDATRLNKLAEIVKDYHVLQYVKAYKWALDNDRQDICIPVIHDVTLADYSELAQLKKGKE